MLGPFLWMLSTSLKTQAAIFRYPPELIPSPPHFENYETILKGLSVSQFFLNSFKISALATIGQLLSCSLAAYAFARMQFRGKGLLYGVLLATMMIPAQVTMIPVFLIMKSLGWIDSHNALIVPAFLGGAFGTFLLRQFFESIPRDLEDAARIDGCGRFRIYWQIILPLAKPALATLGLFTFMSYWNDLLGPVIYLSSVEKMTLTVGLASLQAGEMVARHDLLMAGSMLSIVPMLVLFVLAQKWFVRGVVMTGIKG
ncbi:MAG: carbohydrate ABC transporter permease [Ignavibacteriales bacterium]|nr:carbohydrate ABC transporter permease [Ignavibacteriales bacterium]